MFCASVTTKPPNENGSKSPVIIIKCYNIKFHCKNASHTSLVVIAQYNRIILCIINYNML